MQLIRSLPASCRVHSFRWLVILPSPAALDSAGQPLDFSVFPLAYGVRVFIPEHRRHRLLVERVVRLLVLALRCFNSSELRLLVYSILRTLSSPSGNAFPRSAPHLLKY